MVRTRRRRHRPVLGKMDTNLAVLIAVLQEKTQLIGGLMIHVFFSSCLEYNLIGYLGHILNHNSNFFQTDSHCTLYFALCALRVCRKNKPKTQKARHFSKSSSRRIFSSPGIRLHYRKQCRRRGRHPTLCLLPGRTLHNTSQVLVKPPKGKALRLLTI
jgi:hypothetical protein